MDKYSKEFFVAKGAKGGEATKRLKGANYYKDIRAKRGKKGVIPVFSNNPLDDKKKEV